MSLLSFLRRPPRFPGGLILDGHKEESLQRPLTTAPLPEELIIPLSQHIGAAARPVVQVGDTVLRGQIIARPDGYLSAAVHASSSGTVVALEPRPVPHPSGLDAPCVVIRSDGEDHAADPLPPWQDWAAHDPADIRQRAQDAGIVGFGGAAFPTAVKLNPHQHDGVDTLILNGAECEPYISCDQMLMSERPDSILQGALIMAHALGVKRIIIGIEDNKLAALQALEKARDQLGNAAALITLCVVPTRYPAGGEKQLIQVLTGRQVPSQGLPHDIGVICHNVATAAALAAAVLNGQPVISRLVTVTGPGIRDPQVLEVRIGTPIATLLTVCGGYSVDEVQLILGGPMMGFNLPHDQVPIIKAANCVLVQPVTPPLEAMPCIRCGACVEVCPAQLLPQQLYWYAQAGDLDKTQDYHLFDCIECGCCATVCPSHIPLVQYYRHAKTAIAARERDRQAADLARSRHDFRQQRLAREQTEKEERAARKKAALKQAAATAPETPMAPAATPDGDPRQAAIAAARERAAAKKAAAATNS